jgi:hypothetical protein
MSDDHPYNLLTHFGYWYKQSGNPLHVWQALDYCFDTGAPIPEWVCAYLRDAAKKMSVLAGGRDFREKPSPRINPSDSAKLVGEALGLWRPKTKSAFKRLVQDSMAQRAALNELDNYSYATPADIASLPPVPVVDEKGKPLFHKGPPVMDEKGEPLFQKGSGENCCGDQVPRPGDPCWRPVYGRPADPPDPRAGASAESHEAPGQVWSLRFVLAFRERVGLLDGSCHRLSGAGHVADNNGSRRTAEAVRRILY